MPHGTRAGLPPAAELRHDLVLLGDGGALVLLGGDLLELGFWVGGEHGRDGLVPLKHPICGYLELGFSVWCLDRGAEAGIQGEAEL